jgi:hypothetical protein
MSIAPTLAEAPSGGGPSIGAYGEQDRRTHGPGPALGPAQPLQHSQSGIGGYGEQHRRTLGPRPGPGPAQPLQPSQSGTVREDEFLAQEDCNSCIKAKTDNYCDRKKRCSACIKRNVQCLYLPAGSSGDDPSKPEKFKTCDYCRAHKKKSNRYDPCSTCIRYNNEGKNCHYTDIPKAIEEPAGKAGGTIGSSGVALSQKEKYKTCNYCRAHKTKSCNGNLPCSICIKRDNRGKNCAYDVKHRDDPTNSGRDIDLDEIVPNVRIRREDHSEDLVYVHPPPHIPRPKGLAENMIIGWDRRRGSWVIRYGPSHGNLRGRRPGDIGLNAAGEHAHMIDEHEGGGEMGGNAPPAHPLIRPPLAQPEPEGKTCVRCKNLNLRCDKNKPRCSHCLMGQHQCSLGEVLGVKIQRPDGSLHRIYSQAPPGHTPAIWPGDEIIGWDPLIGFGGLAPGFGSFVICPANRAGLLAHELGKNHLGHPAISADEHEGGGQMGGMRDMRTAATASRPPAQPQGFGIPGPSAPAHSVQGHNLAGSRHQRTSTESPPAEDLAKRRRGPR